MAYSYERLSALSGAIRTLTLFPSRDFDAPLQGQINQTTRQESQYTGISYVWGDPTPFATIQIHDSRLDIAKNVSILLRSIRSPSEPMTLWIDAICINQADEEEKCTAVQDMANIYRAADQVIGWLGEMTHEAQKGLRLFREVTERVCHNDFDNWLEAYLGERTNDTYWIGLLDLFYRPYWTRLWILQEVAVNPNVSLRLGTNPQDLMKIDEIVRFTDISPMLMDKMYRVHYNTHGVVFHQVEVRNMHFFRVAVICRLYPLKIGDFQPLLNYSLRSGPLCSNALDSIFGYIGLFEHPPVMANYGLTPRKLFLDVLETVQHRTRKLDFLSWANINSPSLSSPRFQNEYSLPTWAVDYSWRRSIWHPYALTYPKENQRLLKDTIYVASGESKYTVKIDKEQGFLHLKGCRISTIRAVGSLAKPSMSTIWPRDWSLIAGYGYLESPDKKASERSQTPQLSVWHTGIASEGYPTLSTEQLDVWWRVLFADTVDGNRRIEPPLVGQQPIPPTSMQEFETLCGRMRTTSFTYRGRRMFRTVDSRLGLAPPQTKPGDTVCVLLGGDALYVLRRSSRGANHYQFVGDCYLHGMMDGQALSGRDDDLKEIHIEPDFPSSPD